MSIDQYAEAATGTREYLLNKPHSCSAIDVNGGTYIAANTNGAACDLGLARHWLDVYLAVSVGPAVTSIDAENKSKGRLSDIFRVSISPLHCDRPILEGDGMRRREFIAFVGGAAAAWPLAARAQLRAMPVIGYLSAGTPKSDAAFYLAPFRQGLGEIGYVEGQNVLIEYRWAEFQNDRLPSLAADLVHRSVTVIATFGGTPPALAAKAATSTIPIVFYSGVDPVKFGLVVGLNRPGGNLTGIAALQAELIAKRIELLHEIMPKASVLALLVNPTSHYTETETQVVDDGARRLGLRLHVVQASTANDIDMAFDTMAGIHAGALIVSADLFLHSQRKQLVTLAAKHALPTMYPWREFVTAGGLMSYGPNLLEANRLIGVYSGKILKGAKAAELPVEQNTKVEFVVNLKTAEALGIIFPLPLVGRADEVIE